jgi:GDPmannose 4,6-dehydratase
LTRALITGASGQDGAYLARLLLDRGYEVVGTSRTGGATAIARLVSLGIADRVRMLAAEPSRDDEAQRLVDEIAPHEVYNLGAQSSVGQSFARPRETSRSIVDVTQNLLEAIRTSGRPIRFYGAGSSEMFGDNAGRPSTEDTPLRPRSPYAAAKCAAFWQVATYRESYGLFGVTGILFNHESPLRPAHFVTTKIVETAWAIAHHQAERIELGEIDVVRDWGWAPEYVEAMWRMMRADTPQDLVVATGFAMTLRAFATHAFAYFGLNFDDHLDRNLVLLRPNELAYTCGDARRARQVLGWSAELAGKPLVDRLCAAAESRLSAKGEKKDGG